MRNDRQYKPSGYIEYVPTTMGFVTPVFEDEDGRLVVQVKSIDNRRIEWDLLPESYLQLVKKVAIPHAEGLADSLLYAFKSHDEVFIAGGKTMANFLTNEFISDSHSTIELVQSFLKDWQTLELIENRRTKAEIWDMCLEVIEEISTTFSAIFEREIEVENFTQKRLQLKTKNPAIKNVFEKEFLAVVTNRLREEIEQISITVSKRPLPLPVVSFGDANTMARQGLYFLETSINDYQGFEDLIVGDFNRLAYQKSKEFIVEDSPRIMAFKGSWGTGKSHFLNAIGKTASEQFGSNVAMFKAGNLSSKKGNLEAEINLLASTTKDKQLILIDDLDRFSGDIDALKSLIRLVKAWLTNGKKIAVSYQTEKYILDLLPAFSDQFDEVKFDKPTAADVRDIFYAKSIQFSVPVKNEDANFLLERVESIGDIQKSLIKAHFIRNFSAAVWKEIESDWMSYLHNSLQKGIAPVHFYEISKYQYDVHNRDYYLSMLLVRQFVDNILYSERLLRNFKLKRTPLYLNYSYSFDAIQNHFLTNDEFRETLIEIFRELVGKDKYNW